MILVRGSQPIMDFLKHDLEATIILLICFTLITISYFTMNNRYHATLKRIDRLEKVLKKKKEWLKNSNK